MFHRLFHWRVWSYPAAAGLAHSAPAVWLAAATVLPLLSFASATEWFPEVIGLPLYWTLLVAPGITMLAQIPHQTAMCTRCAANSQPGTAAPRHVRAAQWTYHHRWIQVSPSLAFIAADVFLPYPDWFGKTGAVLILLNAACAVQAVLLHQWHRPSCRYCNDWGDDPDAPVEPLLGPTPPGNTPPV